MTRAAVAVVLAVLAAVALSSCGDQWAQRDCRGHGGLDYVARVSTFDTAWCNDGTRFRR